jgi:hypothetical protein
MAWGDESSESTPSRGFVWQQTDVDAPATSPTHPKGEGESIMFARHVTLQLKPNFEKEFPVAFEKEIMPILRRQKGFLEELVFVTPMKTEAIAISLWEEKEFAEAYHRQVYPEIARIVAKFVNETPVVKNLDVEYATYRKFATATV